MANTLYEINRNLAENISSAILALPEQERIIPVHFIRQRYTLLRVKPLGDDRMICTLLDLDSTDKVHSVAVIVYSDSAIVEELCIILGLKADTRTAQVNVD